MHIQIRELEKEYHDGIKALNNISLELKECSVIGLLGKNGAGKTTFMDILSSIEKATRGSILIDGIAIEKIEDYRSKIGYMPQEFSMYPRITVRENIKYFGYLHNMKKSDVEDRVEVLLETLNLKEHENKKYKALSGGMKRRVGLAVALIHDPIMLIIDEPTAGVDPEERVSIRDYILEIGKDKTIIFSTHIIEDIEQISDYIVILDKGNKRYEGSIEELLSKFQGHIYEVNQSDIDFLGARVSVLRRYKSRDGDKAKVYIYDLCGLNTYSFKEIDVTLEDCFLAMNGSDIGG